MTDQIFCPECGAKFDRQEIYQVHREAEICDLINRLRQTIRKEEQDG